MTDSANDAADATYGIADATEAAGKAAKKSLAGFDELNTLADQSGGSSSSGVSSTVETGGSTVNYTASVDKIDLASAFDFKQITKDIGKLINKIDWEKVFAVIGSTINTVLTAAFNGISDIVSEVDWVEFGEELTNGLGKGIDEIDIPELAGDIVELIVTLVGAVFQLLWGSLTELFSKEGWEETILPWLKDFFKEIAEGLLDGALNLDPTTAEGAEASDFFGVLEEYWPYIEEYFKWSGENAIEGFFEGIEDAISSPFEWIKENVFDPFMEGFCDVFGIHSPATTMEEPGENVIHGFFEGIEDAISAPYDWLKENVFDPFVSDFKSLFGIEDGESTVTEGYGKEIIKGLKSGLTDSLSWDSIERGLQTAWQAVGIWWSGTALGGLLDDITDFFNDPDWASMNNLTTIFGTAFTDAANAAIDVLNDMIDWINKKLKFTIPEMELMGTRLWPETKVTLASVPKIPRLAQGAVLPPNKPFMAIVGDQKHGTNVEAPLSTIQEAVAVVMQDQVSAMMAGFNALLEENRLLRETVECIEFGDTTIGEANQRYINKMAIVKGG